MVVRLWQVCPAQAAKANLRHFLFEHDKLNGCVDAWAEYVCHNWVLHKYEAQWKADKLVSIIQPRAVFVVEQPLGRVLSSEAIDWSAFAFNHFHPWVKAMLDTMPAFYPIIMFRQCVLKCYNRRVSPGLALRHMQLAGSTSLS